MFLLCFIFCSERRSLRDPATPRKRQRRPRQQWRGSTARANLGITVVAFDVIERHRRPRYHYHRRGAAGAGNRTARKCDAWVPKYHYHYYYYHDCCYYYYYLLLLLLLLLHYQDDNIYIVTIITYYVREERAEVGEPGEAAQVVASRSRDEEQAPDKCCGHILYIYIYVYMLILIILIL